MGRRQFPSLAVRLGVDSGCHRLLETPLVIAGAEGSTILRFLGSQASAAGWAEYGGAGTLDLQAGTAPTYGVPSPYLGALDGGCRFNEGGYFQRASAGMANFTTHDIVVEALVLGGFAMNAWIAGTWADTGWVFRESGLGLYSWSSRGAPAVYKTFDGPAASAGVVHILAVYDSSGSGILYVNAVGGTAVSVATCVDVASTTPFWIGGSGGAPWTGTLFFLGIHARASGWLDTHSQPALARARTDLAFGSRPLISIASATSLAAGGNAGPAYQERIVSGAQRLSYMGTGAPRFVQRLDGAGRTFVGALVEAGAENIALQSQAFSTSPWGVSKGSISATSVICPDGIARAVNTLHEDATANTLHYLLQSFAAGTFTASMWLRSALRTFVQFRLQDGERGADFNLTTGAVTGKVAATAGSENYGSGWWRCWIRALNSAGASLVLSIAESAGDVAFDGLDQDSIYIYGAQVTTGNYPSSYIPTTTAAVTRAADAPHRISGAAHFGAGRGALFCRFLSPSFTPGRNHFLFTAYKTGAGTTDAVTCWIDTSGHLNVASAKSAGNAGAVEIATNYCDNLIHDLVVSWETNNLRCWVDGVQSNVDTSCDFATDMDLLDIGADNAAALQAGPVLVGEPQLCPQPVLGPIPLPSGFLYTT